MADVSPAAPKMRGVAARSKVNVNVAAFQATYGVPGRVTVKNTGEAKSLDLLADNYTPSLVARSVPKRSATAYLYAKITTALNRSIKIGFGVEAVIATATFALAGPIAAIFSTGEGGERIQGDLENLIRILAVHYPFVAFGMFSSSMFQGTGKGMYALAVTILRTIVLTLLFAVVLTQVMDMGLDGVWWGVNLGNTMGAMVAFVWAKVYIARLNGEGHAEDPSAVPG